MITPHDWRTRTSQYEPEAFDIVQPGLGAIALVKNEKFALLIAAAPDLLEALKNLLEAHYNGNVIKSDCLDAEAALAKATGEQL